MRIVVGYPVRQLVQARLPDKHGPGLLQPLDRAQVAIQGPPGLLPQNLEHRRDPVELSCGYIQVQGLRDVFPHGGYSITIMHKARKACGACSKAQSRDGVEEKSTQGFE